MQGRHPWKLLPSRAQMPKATYGRMQNVVMPLSGVQESKSLRVRKSPGGYGRAWDEQAGSEGNICEEKASARVIGRNAENVRPKGEPCWRWALGWVCWSGVTELTMHGEMFTAQTVVGNSTESLNPSQALRKCWKITPWSPKAISSISGRRAPWRAFRQAFWCGKLRNTLYNLAYLDIAKGIT